MEVRALWLPVFSVADRGGSDSRKSVWAPALNLKLLRWTDHVEPKRGGGITLLFDAEDKRRL